MGHVLRCSGYDLVIADMVRGRDCYLYDARGNRYVDFEAGVWCTALGHNHPRVSQAIHAQLERVMHLAYRYTNGIVEEAALAVLETVELADGQCIFLSSGSEAVEFGVQIARRITGQPLLLTLTDAYLAAYGSAGRKSPEEWYSFDWRECSACLHPQECDAQCPHMRDIPFDRIGGLVFEPGNTGGLVRFPPQGLLQSLVAQVRRRQGLVVVDEVTTGLGRTGAWYGYQHYGLDPDIVVLGKGLGNGYPVSAVAMAGDVAARLRDTGFRYAQSHQNDPLGCAVAREVIAVLREEGLIERSRQVGIRFVHALERLGQRHEAVTEVRGRGLMVAMEFRGDGEHLPVSQVYSSLVGRGFLAGCKPEANLLRFYPPLTIGDQEISELLQHLDDLLAA
jgi:acetylornithine/N-succinyldiaminopimelate aminotransferase